ncbi:hypothetical protein ABH926_006399 [Catenulispora sp. GP43]|uniref:hypothetical protein n=1 Tax=Catenulispora sp. GP43 TaxID=3156263 RepID=UPI003519065E
MRIRKAAGAVIGAVLSIATITTFAAMPAQASTANGNGSDNGSVVTIDSANGGAGTDSVLSVTFDKTLDATKLAQVRADLAQRAGARATGVKAASSVAGPQGAWLYCNDPYSFSDSDGTYSFQHACGGTTGPWGYKVSSGLCAIVVGDINEVGMGWTRNGVNQGRAIGHPVPCSYQLHGAYNPDHDYDYLTYTDTVTFEVEVDGDTGHATLNITGSFTSAGCANGHACGM